MTAQRVHCTNHCATCGTHFHSVAAFDAHRAGDHASNDPMEGRHCVHPLDVRGRDDRTPFIALTTVGLCDLARSGPLANVTIWTLRDKLEQARRMRQEKDVGGAT